MVRPLCYSLMSFRLLTPAQSGKSPTEFCWWEAWVVHCCAAALVVQLRAPGTCRGTRHSTLVLLVAGLMGVEMACNISETLCKGC